MAPPPPGRQIGELAPWREHWTNTEYELRMTSSSTNAKFVHRPRSSSGCETSLLFANAQALLIKYVAWNDLFRWFFTTPRGLGRYIKVTQPRIIASKLNTFQFIRSQVSGFLYALIRTFVDKMHRSRTANFGWYLTHDIVDLRISYRAGGGVVTTHGRHVFKSTHGFEFIAYTRIHFRIKSVEIWYLFKGPVRVYVLAAQCS
jgi:hypothetical protein